MNDNYSNMVNKFKYSGSKNAKSANITPCRNIINDIKMPYDLNKDSAEKYLKDK